MAQLRKNKSGNKLKLRLGIKLAREKRPRIIEVGLRTPNVENAKLVALTVMRILSMAGVGEGVWTLRGIDGQLITNSEIEALTGDCYIVDNPLLPPIFKEWQTTNDNEN